VFFPAWHSVGGSPDAASVIARVLMAVKCLADAMLLLEIVELQTFGGEPREKSRVDVQLGARLVVHDEISNNWRQDRKVLQQLVDEKNAVKRGSNNFGDVQQHNTRRTRRAKIQQPRATCRQ
jgi:hypothetical protein